MKAPFRADHVGSLLRPQALVEARSRARDGKMSAVELRKAEDEAIRAVVAKQEAIGLESVTDGELRRDWWHIDFMRRIEGVAMIEHHGPQFRQTGEQPPIAAVTGPVRFAEPIMVADFQFLKDCTSHTAKFTIPSPSMLHLRGGRKGISRAAYPDLEEFWVDLGLVYRRAIAALAEAGCRYLQLDDVSFAYLCDPKVRARCIENGDDPEQLPHTYAHAVNAALLDRPPGMAITMHTCRGNFKSSWVAEGGYESVAETMFSSAVDGFFMEFDDERSGGFEPLRHLSKRKKVVLGLITTKLGSIESKDEIKRRIDAASKYVPLENLCLSPQCGFSSTHHGNALSEGEQWRKLELVVEVAREVWG